ncbi:postacrosomal sheath WW domain-binding protein [Amia ocellicauda]|uniref:postacrosomal sheath WW domain-binding protein n=1 Tax=Amia ocellicauda TaxID=2972642 RepID=UPI0034642920
MALNRNHSQSGGVLINNGESVLKECKDVELSFSDVTCKTDALRGSRKGTVYLTPYRMVFVSKGSGEGLRSFVFPFYLVKNCSIEQPVFNANYIRGTVRAEPGGGWEGQASFKMSFASGGAIEFGQLMFKVATNASRAPPAQNGGPVFGYCPPGGAVSGYAPPPGPTNGFYPAPPAAQGNGFYPAPPPAQGNGFYPAPPPAQGNGFYPAPPLAQGNMGYPYPATAAGGYPSAPPMAPVYMPPPPPYPGPPTTLPTAPPGWTPPQGNNPKATEAAASAFYNPNNPHSVYMPMDQPPPYAPYAPNPEKKNN